MLFFYAPYFAKSTFSEVMPRLFLCGNLLPSLSLLAFFNANLQDLMQDAAFSFANIAQRLHKSDSTVSREIIRNHYKVKTSANHTALCARVNVCTMANLCSTDCNLHCDFQVITFFCVYCIYIAANVYQKNGFLIQKPFLKNSFSSICKR